LIQKVASLLQDGELLSTKLASAAFVKSVLNGVAADKNISGLTTKIDYLGDVLASANSAINAVTGPTPDSSAAITLLQNAIKVQSATQGTISNSLEAYARGGAQPNILGATLTQAIAEAVTGVIVPARVEIAAGSTSIATVNEGPSGGTSDFSVTLTRSGNVDSVVTLKYSLAVGDGVTRDDFALNAIPAGNVTFASGQTTVTLTIKVKGDNVKELAENFSVILTDPLGQTQLIDAAGNATASLSRGFVIANDDPLTPTFTLPATLDLVADGTAKAISGISLDYYKTDTNLTVTIKAAVGTTLSVVGYTPTNVNKNGTPQAGAVTQLELTGTLSNLQTNLAALRVTVPSTQTEAFLAFEALDPAALNNKGLADVSMTLHHAATLVLPAMPENLMAGLETSLAGFKVTDLDGDTVTLRLKPVNAVLDVSVLPTGVGMVEEDDGGLTLTGTPRLLNLTLDSLTITAIAGNVRIVASLDDGDSLTTEPNYAAISGTAAAAPTTVALPDGLLVSAGQVAGVSGISVSDIDSDQLTVRLTPTGGELNFAIDLGTLSVARTDSVASNVTTVTLSGSKDNINQALDSLTFKAGLTANSGSIRVLAGDGNSLADRTVNISIAQNAPPEAGGAFTTERQLEEFTGTLTIGGLNGLNLVNSDGALPTGVRIVSVTGATLSYNNSAITLGQSGDVLTLNGSKQLVLGVALNTNYTSDVKISYVVVDPVDPRLNSLPSTITVPVTAINDAPVVAPNGLTYTFTEGATPVSILQGLNVSDVDSTNLTSARVSIGSGYDVNDLLRVPDNAALLAASGITANYSNGVLSLTGAASLSAYQTALRSVTFSNTSDNPSTTPSRQISVVVTDDSASATASSSAISRTVAVVSVNDAPTISYANATLPDVGERVPSSLAGIGISIADLDAGNNALTLTLGVTSGVLNATAGTSGVVISGSGTNTLTLNGSQSAIRSILSGVDTQSSLTYYNDSRNPASLDRLSLSLNDNGASGLGGALSTTTAYDFRVISVNDSPLLSLSGKALYASDTGSALLSPQGTVSDADSSYFSAIQVQITTGLTSLDNLFLNTAAQQTLSSAGFTSSYNSANGTLSIVAIPPAPGAAAKVLSQEDVASVLAGVSFSKSASVVDGVNAIRISDGESRVIVYSVTDNSGSATATSLNASLDLALQKAPFASIVDVQTLKFNGDPKSASVSVDLSTFRVLANGAAVGVSGGNLFSVKDVDASGATSTSVQLVGSSVANKLTGTSLATPSRAVAAPTL
jgi:hypothetical protein